MEILQWLGFTFSFYLASKEGKEDYFFLFLIYSTLHFLNLFSKWVDFPQGLWYN